MYEELIKRLRASCEDCKLWDGYRCCLKGDCTAQTRLQAANTIEELKKAVLRLEDESGIYDELPTFYIYPTKWIPVTERLPKDGEFVLVCNDDKHMMIAKYETETYEWYHKYTNYDFDIWDNEEQGPVCYWMPLPEAPKDGE